MGWTEPRVGADRTYMGGLERGDAKLLRSPTNALTERHSDPTINAIPQITLNNGVQMPILGFGVFQIPADISKSVPRVD